MAQSIGGAPIHWGERPNPALALPPRQTAHIVSAFVRVAARVPHKAALVDQLSRWTFEELDRSSDELALALRATGVERGDVVAIVSGREPALVCAMLAVLKAGAAFATINDSYPLPRISACLQAARPAQVMLVGNSQLGSEALLGLPTVIVPSQPNRAGSSARERPTLHVTGNDAAYLMFTSGSTGEPKCIATGHSPLPHFVRWHTDTFGLTENDHFSMLSGLSHDPLLRDIFTPLSLGATLHIPNQSVLTDPAALFSWLKAEGISVAHLTPPLGQVLLAGAEERTLSQLRYLFWGGDVLRPNLVKELRAVAPHAAHVNFYGTTETPQAVGFFQVQDVESSERIPVGRGIADVDLLVLLENGELAPAGELGELVVRTRYLSLGYWGSERGTQEKYRTNPHTADPEDRMYRTGDLAKYRSDGNVEFWGRADDQVKVRGYRVELSEVTAILSRCPAVRELTVLGRVDASGETQLIAYASAAPGRELTPAVVAEFAKRELPSQLRPSACLVLPTLPLLENGKLDRRALLDLPLQAGQETQAGNDRERALAKIWAGVLGVQNVGVNESFYSLGGDSLTAIRVMVNMRTLGLDPELCRQILQGRTIAQMAAGAASGSGNGASSNLDAHKRLVLNITRGVMVVLLVCDHWAGGIFRRSDASAALEPYFNPVFNWPTPGFAIAFGMTLGLIHYPIYRKSVERARSLLGKSAVLVFVGMLVMALDRWILGILGYPRGAPFGIMLFDTVLAYYFLALLSARVWFRLLNARHGLLAAASCGGLLILTYQLVLSFSHGVPGESVLWMGAIMGKYSYLNLSGGALIGMALGTRFSREDRIPRHYLALGCALTLSGVLLSRVPGRFRVFDAPSQIPPWEWLLYLGLSLLTLFALDRWLSARARAGRHAGATARVLGVLGQLALPLFVLDMVARDLGYFSIVLGLPVTRFLIPIGVFGGVAFVLAGKTYGLYYGPIQPGPVALDLPGLASDVSPEGGI